MKSATLSEILKLSVAERIQFVEDVWDSIAAVPQSVNLSDAQKEELEQRLEAYHKKSASGSPWEEVKARISYRTCL